MRTYLFPLLASAAISLGTTACSSQSVSSEATPVSKAQSNHNTAYQKPGAAIRFSVENAGPVSVGAIQTVRINVINEYESGDVVVSVGDTPGVRVYSDIREHRFAMAGQKSHTFDLQVSADREGRFSIPLMAKVGQADGQTMLRAGAVVLNVGNQNPKARIADTAADAEKPSTEIIVMEAEETIRTAD